MQTRRSLILTLSFALLIGVPGTHAAETARGKKVGHPSFMSPHATPIALTRTSVFVVNTPADTVDVIDRGTRKVTARIPVGVDPVSLAIRPDGQEVWVSNHISDSVSVIDTKTGSPTYLHVVATIQQFDGKRATRFDEPVGIAFASNKKAYIALSSENTIAVVDVSTRRVTRRLNITAQDPRAIRVRGQRLYVIPFESNNQTQLSGGGRGKKFDGNLITFDAHRHSIAVNNVLSIGHVVDVVKHPRVPDRDLYVFDTETDELIESVNTLGTLLYGLAVDSQGKVFIAQTDARNEVNGRSGTKKHGLKEMENRAFLNRITAIAFRNGKATKPRFFDLEPLPPKHPAKGQALATPFAIQVSDDDSTLVVSAAGSDKVFTVDAKTGSVLGRVPVGHVPRGIALESRNGKAVEAWVLNAIANTVTLLDVSNRSKPQVVTEVTLQDPTHPTVKRGRIAFNTAAGSTTRTFSCASCHPDGHTDQLLWVLNTPIVTGGNQIMPRSTMPIRGLRDTAPFHWDGIPGDPYGGINSASIRRHVKPNSKKDDPASATRHLIDGGLANTMMLVGDKTKNDKEQAGELTDKQRQDMATFLLSVPYPPAQRRPYTNVVSRRARRGFKLFHLDGDLQGRPRPNVCGDCHRMPFLVSTNTPGTGMDAPTWRGAYDRFLILPQGRLNIIDFDFYRRVADSGNSERRIWQFSWAGRRRFDPVWDMVLEGSTGYVGAFARQVTLSKATVKQRLTADLLNALEQAARDQAVVLECEGIHIHGGKGRSVSYQFQNGSYVSKDGQSKRSRKVLAELAAAGKFVGTFTARHGAEDDVDHPQPGIWTLSPLERQSGRQVFPILHPGNQRITIHGRHLRAGARVFLDGRQVAGKMTFGKKERIHVQLKSLPKDGMHLLQLQNPQGMISNDFIFFVAKDSTAAATVRRRLDRDHLDIREALARAIEAGSISETKELLRRRRSRINGRRPRHGSTPLSTAALHGHTEIVKLLLDRKANVKSTNRDGNTALHVAAFMCRTDIVKMLLKNGASTKAKNRRGETPIDVVSKKWTKQLAGFYTAVARGARIKIDLKTIQLNRKKIAKLLRDHS